MKAKTGIIAVVISVALLQPVLAQGDPQGKTKRQGRSVASESSAPRVTVSQEQKEPSKPLNEGGQKPEVTIGERPNRGGGESMRQGPGESMRQGPGESVRQGPGESVRQGPGESSRRVQITPPRVDGESAGGRNDRNPGRLVDGIRDVGGLLDPPPPKSVEPVVPRVPTPPRTVIPQPEPHHPQPRTVIPQPEPYQRQPEPYQRQPEPFRRQPEPFPPPPAPMTQSTYPSTGAIVLMENFESQPGGSLPPGWTVVFSGQGSNAQGVRTENGNSYLRVAGRANWSGVLRLDLDQALPSSVEFQSRVRRSGGLNGIGIGNGSRCICYQLTDIGIRDGGWHDVLIVVDFGRLTSSCTVDGRCVVPQAAVGEQDSRAKWSWWGARPAIVLDSGNQSEQEIDIDDIMIQARR